MYTETMILNLLLSSVAAVEKAIHTLWKCQTADERAGRSTHVWNNVGFNRMDAKSGCYYGSFIDDCLRGTKGYAPRKYGEILSLPWAKDGSALKFPEGGFTTHSPEYRVWKCRKIARKYVRQLTKLANAKLADKAYVDSVVDSDNVVVSGRGLS